MTNNEKLKEQLPPECQSITIEPRHRVALQHYIVGDHVWVVLLTVMPGDSPKAWKLTKYEYWKLQPKHGTRDRFIRENYQPTIKGEKNQSRPITLTLF